MHTPKPQTKSKRKPSTPKNSTTPLPTNPNQEPDIEDFSTQATHTIRASLLHWYDQNQRTIPWRRKPTNPQEETNPNSDSTQQRAYAVWVSEIMLQQTRVATVIDYYNRWMEKWPTIHHLARASQEEVNEMWAGLGYYRRARFLLEGAKKLDGVEFPGTVEGLLQVPGIGQYTAGAIASIAFNQVVPVVDGNVIRVLARLKAISANPKATTTIKSFWKLAGQLVDPCRPGDFNQALMELGATICAPTSPNCSVCPIAEQCQALSLSKISKSAVTDFPTKVPKTKQRLDFCAVCVVEILDNQGIDTQQGTERNNVFLLVKRPEDGLLAGLWEFPSVLMAGEANLTMRREAMDLYLKKSFKLDTKKKQSVFSRNDVGECVHIFSHIRLRMYVEWLVLHVKGGNALLYDNENSDTLAWKCVDSNAIQSIGLTSGVRKVYNMVKQFKQSQLDVYSTGRKRKKN